MHKKCERLDRMLPTEAYYQGWNLTWWAPDVFAYGDPVILSKPGQELYRWDYIPCLTEVFEVCRQLIEKG